MPKFNFQEELEHQFTKNCSWVSQYCEMSIKIKFFQAPDSGLWAEYK